MVNYILTIMLITLISPFLVGIIKSFKMFMLFKKPISPFQPYMDFAKLIHKEVIYSKESSIVSKIAPFMILAPIIVVIFLLPPIFDKSFYISFMDAFTITGLLSLSTFFLMLLGLDSASSFGGIGSSREAFISSLVEPAMVLSLFSISLIAQNIGVGGAVMSLNEHFPIKYSSAFILAGISFFILLIAENGRIPVDNPETHLELTMVHEAMILDTTGPNLALIEIAGALKFGIFAYLFADIFLPFGLNFCWCLAILVFILKLILISIVVGWIEINTAKLRLFKVPNLLGIAMVFGFLSLFIFYII